MKKGFTLIELLAVILILGIIALIAIPTVNKIINEARYGAFKTGNDNIMKTIEQSCQTNLMNNKNLTLSYIFKEGKSSNEINIKGALPNDGYILLDRNCNVTNYYLKDNKNVYSNEEDVREDYMLKAPIEQDTSIFKSLYPDYYDNLGSFNFVNHLDIPNDAIEIKDPSVSEKGKIKSWIIEDNGLYNLYIGSNNTIYGNYDSSYLLSNSTAKVANLDNFHTDFVQTLHCFFLNGLYEYLYVDNWNTSNVTNMRAIFYKCFDLKSLDLSKWDVHNVTTMHSMFAGIDTSNDYHSLETIGDVSRWDTSSLTMMYSMFYSCSKLKYVDVSNWDVSKVTNMNRLFYQCNSLESVDISNWDVSNVSDFRSMFCLCVKLKELNFMNWKIKKTAQMNHMFHSTIGITTLDLSTIDLSIVTNLSEFLYGLTNLTTLNLSNIKFNDTIVTTNLFQYDNNLNTIIMENSNSFSVNKVIENLLERPIDNKGKLIITNVDNINLIDVATLESKNWYIA